MKWYHWTILVFALALIGALFAAFRIWWTCPLGPPLEIEKLLSLAPDYTRYWGIVAALFGAVCVAALAELGVIIRLLVEVRNAITSAK